MWHISACAGLEGMVLTDLKFNISYASDSRNIIRDFYVPCLLRSRRYRRAVGYFTSQGLSVAAQGIAHLLNNGGQIQLIASPSLTDEDIEAIATGYKRREEALFDITAKAFKEIEDELTKDRLNALAWLIATKALDVRLALRTDSERRLKRGIFHEKMGIFTDMFNNSVAFSGSPNETVGGLIENYEAIDVYWSWDDPQGRVNDKLRRFERLWDNETSGLEVIDFTQATIELLMAFKKDEPPSEDPLERINYKYHKVEEKKTPSIPQEVSLRDYQQEAIENWIKNNGRGSFKMATGTGKTITALGIAVTLYQKIGLQATIIVCPYRHLVSQWAEECKKFGFRPILAFEKRDLWESPLANALYNISEGEFICAITTNKTFASPTFQNKIKYFPKKSLIIADEAHNLGAFRLRECLPESINLRLALSATPERWFDEHGTEELFNYFGPILEPQLTLKEAIIKKALVPYRYYPMLVELSDDEREEYLSLSEKIAKIFHQIGDEDENNMLLSALLTKRARLIASACNKLIALRELMKKKINDTHMLFYCGDGTVDDPVTQEEMRHVDAVCKLLGHELGIRIASFTAETILAEREVIKRQLDNGELQGLVAIRCLDEGVDIPSVKTAVILASSRNPRQFIQRRGRVLRPSPGKTSAEIYDMIVTPPEEVTAYASERSLLRNELIRFAEFADLALNGGEARRGILDLQRRYGLLDI